MNKCAIIRKTQLEDQVKSTTQLNNFDELDNEEDNSDTLLKNKIRDEMKKDYVDTKILTQDQLNDMLNIWIDHI